MQFKQGFTMIELLIVLAVIGVLTAVALPAYQNHVAAGDVDRCINFITPARMTADSVIQANSGSAVSVTAASIGIGTGGNNCDAIAVVGDAIGNVTISGTVNTDVGNNTMSWSRTSVSGIWSCTSSNSDLSVQICP